MKNEEYLGVFFISEYPGTWFDHTARERLAELGKNEKKHEGALVE